jgi:hypothetical protein
MLSLFGIVSILSILVASFGAGLTAYNLLAIGPRTALSTIAGLSILSAGLGLMVIAVTMMPGT